MAGLPPSRARAREPIISSSSPPGHDRRLPRTQMVEISKGKLGEPGDKTAGSNATNPAMPKT